MATVLVTGIGGNVGQGILRNARAFDPTLRLVGTDLRLVTGGNHLCDQVYGVPAAKAPDYLDQIKTICAREKVDLIIPSTDVEGFYLSLGHSQLPVLAFSPKKTNMIFWDKYITWEEFHKAGIPFASSRLPSAWKNDFAKFILKPRKGQGSRGLHINPPSMSGFSDAEYMVQELHEGEEITTAFYVTKNRELHGFITFRRELQTGFTNVCEVISQYDDQLKSVLNAMVENFEIAGSCNIQSIAGKGGQIFPFEINGRISGTNSIRAAFGFKDVEYTLQEYLLNKPPSQPKITPGCAARVLMDVIYPGQTLSEVKTKNSRHFIS